MRDYDQYTILDKVTPVAITSSTNATPIVVTASSHGFTPGQLILIQGHATNTNANGIFQVGTVTTNTFSLLDRYLGTSVAGNGVGSGGIAMTAPKIVSDAEFIDATLQIDTSGGANFTLLLAGTNGQYLSGVAPQNAGDDNVNFGATQSVANPYTFIGLIDLDSGNALAGSTGVTTAGTDIHKTFEINENNIKYLTLLITAWSAGAISASIRVGTRGA